jgi:hypothetical protein
MFTELCVCVYCTFSVRVWVDLEGKPLEMISTDNPITITLTRKQLIILMIPSLDYNIFLSFINTHI